MQGTRKDKATASSPNSVLPSATNAAAGLLGRHLHDYERETITDTPATPAVIDGTALDLLDIALPSLEDAFAAKSLGGLRAAAAPMSGLDRSLYALAVSVEAIDYHAPFHVINVASARTSSRSTSG